MLLWIALFHSSLWLSIVAQTVKNLPAKPETAFNPWVRKIPWRREWLLTLILLPREFHGQRSLAGYSPWSCKELDTTEQLTLSILIYPKYYHFNMTLKEKLLIICFTLFFISLLNLIYNILLEHISIQISHISSAQQMPVAHDYHTGQRSMGRSNDHHPSESQAQGYFISPFPQHLPAIIIHQELR